MRTIWIAIAVTAVFALAPAMAQTWTTYASDELGYTIDFPAPPTKSQEKVPDTDEVTTALLLDQGSRAFVTSSTKGFPPVGAAEVVDAGLDGAVKANGPTAKLLSRTPLTIPGGAGVDATFTGDGGLVYRTRFYFVASSLFQAVVGVDNADALQSPDVIRFFDSYHLLVK